MKYSIQQTGRSAIQLIAANGVEKIFGFLMIPLLTNSLSKFEYGELVLSYTVASFITMVVYGGLQSAFYRWYSIWDNEHHKDDYELAVILLIGFFSLITLIFIASFLFLFGINPIGVNGKLLVVVILSNFCLIPYSIRLSTWILTGESQKNILYLFLKGLLVYVGVNLLLENYNSVYTRPCVEIVVFIFVSIPIFISLIRRFNKITWRQFKVLFPVLKDSLSFGINSLALQLGFLFMAISDRIIVDSILDGEALAIYTIGMVAMILVAGIDAFISAYGARANLLYSNIENKYKIEREQIIVILVAWISFNILKAILYCFSKEIIIVLANESYLDAWKIVSLPADVLFFQFLFHFISRYFYAKNELKTLVIPIVIGGMSNIIIGILLVKFFGMIGVIMSSIAVIFMLSIYLEVVVLNRTGKSTYVLFLIVALGLLQIIGNCFMVSRLP